MALKAVLASQDEFNALPEAMREHYTEQDGTWVLSLDGPTRREAALGTKVNEFRDTNIALSRERDEATRAAEETKRTLEAVDLEEFERLKQAHATLDKKGVTKPEDIDQIVQQAVAAAVKPMQDQLQTAAEREQAAHARLAQESFTRLVTEQASRAGVRPEALPDVIGRAGQHGFVMQAGQAVVLGEHGVPKASTARPGEAFSLGEWLMGLKRDGGAHLFKPSVGSGDQGQPGTPGPMSRGGTARSVGRRVWAQPGADCEGRGHRRPDRDRVAGRVTGEGGHPRGGCPGYRPRRGRGSVVQLMEQRGSRGADSRSPGGIRRQDW